jgi:beta-lactamase regulating signal transducer with metallopeptidase domain
MTAAIHLTSLNLASFHAIAQLSAARIVDCLVEGTLVAAFTGLVLRMARRWNSGARFAVCFSALVAVAALPLFSIATWVGGADTSAAALTRPKFTLPGSWALWLFGAWAGIAAVGLARVGVGLWRLRALRSSCLEVDAASLDPEVRQILADASRDRSRSRRAMLCFSDRVSVPTVIGFINPAVVIPRWLLQELSPSELQQILLHELAHLQRWDDWTNLAQKLLKALLFFHPAAWWIEKQMSLEREMACDDAVVAETANPRAYAECLTHLAEKSFVRRSLALAQAALGRIRQTSLRVAQILNADRPSAPAHGWKPAVLLVAGFAIACATGISRAPRLVGFEDSFPKAAQIASGPSDASPAAAFLASYSASSSSAAPQATVVESGRSLHDVNARFRTSQPHVVPVKRAQRNSDLVQDTYWTVAVFEANGEANGDANDASIPSPQPLTADLFYSTDFATGPTPATEAVFVIVEGRGPGLADTGSAGIRPAGTGSAEPAAYRISVWRVVLHSPNENSTTNTIPQKET